MTKLLNRLLLVTVVVMMSACKPIWYKPAEPAETLWQQRSVKLAALNNWSIKGRTAITQGSEGWTAGLNWQDLPERYQIALTGPFAQGGAVLTGDNQQVVLTMADGTTVSAATPEALLKDNLGIHMPVSALRDWVRGLPYQKYPVESMQLDIEGRITHLKQKDWQIEILRYVPFEHYYMPAKIFIKHPDINLKLIIRDWERAK